IYPPGRSKTFTISRCERPDVQLLHPLLAFFQSSFGAPLATAFLNEAVILRTEAAAQMHASAVLEENPCSLGDDSYCQNRNYNNDPLRHDTLLAGRAECGIGGRINSPIGRCLPGWPSTANLK